MRVCLCPACYHIRLVSWLMLLCDLQCGKSWFIQATFNQPQLKILWHAWPHLPCTHTHRNDHLHRCRHTCHCACSGLSSKLGYVYVDLKQHEHFFFSLEWFCLPLEFPDYPIIPCTDMVLLWHHSEVTMLSSDHRLSVVKAFMTSTDFFNVWLFCFMRNQLEFKIVNIWEVWNLPFAD